ncbi:hypothetical protein K402DRAFT_452335 [Aulographum hederae CBS 113979]|uniref:Uncharacterized protein n=1 Tax=Aulographum hederae CBS 113979 TaxID=1176131 RepID=A0A6G1H7U6_9PEZI|nr:hypothetical protein K402DRAFT_452335 [Aulographum hederae CBS 113979]
MSSPAASVFAPKAEGAQADFHAMEATAELEFPPEQSLDEIAMEIGLRLQAMVITPPSSEDSESVISYISYNTADSPPRSPVKRVFSPAESVEMVRPTPSPTNIAYFPPLDDSNPEPSPPSSPLLLAKGEPPVLPEDAILASYSFSNEHLAEKNGSIMRRLQEEECAAPESSFHIIKDEADMTSNDKIALLANRRMRRSKQLAQERLGLSKLPGHEARADALRKNHAKLGEKQGLDWMVELPLAGEEKILKPLSTTDLIPVALHIDEEYEDRFSTLTQADDKILNGDKDPLVKFFGPQKFYPRRAMWPFSLPHQLVPVTENVWAGIHDFFWPDLGSLDVEEDHRAHKEIPPTMKLRRGGEEDAAAAISKTVLASNFLTFGKTWSLLKTGLVASVEEPGVCEISDWLSDSDWESDNGS